MERHQITYMALEELIPYEKNNKIHDENQIKKIARSIREIGFRAPILVDENNVILAGHWRLEGAKRAKLKEVPVIKYTDLTEEQKKKYRILDNRLGDLAEYDLDALKEELSSLDAEWINEMFNEFDLGLNDEDKWDEDTEDDVPEVDEEEETIVQQGDIFELQGKAWNHILICGDSTKTDTFESLKKAMEIKSFDMVFTDPPYNVNYKGRWKNTSRGIANDHMGNQNFYDFLIDSFEQMVNNTKATAPFYIFHSHKTQATFEQAMNESGIEMISQLIWNKPNVNHVGAKYKQKHEPFFYAHKKNQKEERYWSDIFEETVQDVPNIAKMKTSELVEKIKHAQQMESEGKTTIRSMKRHNVNDYIHPTQKPVEIVEKALYNSSKLWDTVLEPFAWSWTTLMACEKTWRRCWAVEFDPHFIQAIIKRYAGQTGKGIKCINRELDLSPILA